MKRRGFIRTTGASTCLGFVGAVAARSEQPVSAREIGVRERLQNLVDNWKHEEAKKLAAKHDIPFAVGEERVPGMTGQVNEAESGPGTFAFSDNGSTLKITNWLGQEEGDYDVTASIKLLGKGEDGNNHHIADVFGIHYDSTEWSSVNPNKDENLETSISWNCEHHPNYEAEFKEIKYNPTSGAAAKIMAPENAGQWSSYRRLDSKMKTTLTMNESTGNEEIPVKAMYNHTWSPTKYISNVSVGIGFAGISVDLKRGHSAWRKGATAAVGHLDRD